MKVLFSLFLFLPFFLNGQSDSQHIIAPQGDYDAGQKMTLTWTIGDLVTETGKVAQGSITQGFQQPVITVRQLDDSKQTHLNPSENIVAQRESKEFTATVFPNPVGSNITVQIENANGEYFLDLYDTSGNLLLRGRSNNPLETIDLSSIPASQYILRISMIESQQSKAFSIIKSN